MQNSIKKLKLHLDEYIQKDLKCKLSKHSIENLLELKAAKNQLKQTCKEIIQDI